MLGELIRQKLMIKMCRLMKLSSDPRTNYSVRNSKQLSGTYYLFSKFFLIVISSMKSTRLGTWALGSPEASLSGIMLTSRLEDGLYSRQ